MEVWIRPSHYYLCENEGPMPFPVPGSMWDRKLGEKLYADSMRFFRRVDELGFDGLLFTEHHFGPNGGLTPSPLVLLAAATGVTERIKLVTLGIPLAMYPHPLRVAEELAMVDNLSHGRVVAGFISSGAQSLYAYNVPASEERSRYHEALDLVLKAWTADSPFEWHSQHFNYPCVSILPRPLQAPHPPLWTTANSTEGLQWAASKRMGFITSGSTAEATESLGYYRSYAESNCGWLPPAEKLGIAREFFIAETKEQVKQMAEQMMETSGDAAFTGLFRDPKLAGIRGEASAVRSYTHVTNPEDRTVHRTAEGTQNGRFIFGDPEQVADQILTQHQTTGAGVLIIRPELGGISMDQAAEGLELFAREVLPLVHAA
jgi:alkanesulfonate monooxygenase SsuD/methylene tetrahydromethanopterin reductase-like flavin-dependent oxidoreductase (luciferase family)